MFGNDEFLERFEIRLGGFENDQHLRARLHFALPPIVRFDSGNQVRTGDEAGFEGGFRKNAGGYQLGSSDQHSYQRSSSGYPARDHVKSAPHADEHACLCLSFSDRQEYEASGEV